MEMRVFVVDEAFFDEIAPLLRKKNRTIVIKNSGKKIIFKLDFVSSLPLRTENKKVEDERTN